MHSPLAFPTLPQAPLLPSLRHCCFSCLCGCTFSHIPLSCHCRDGKQQSLKDIHGAEAVRSASLAVLEQQFPAYSSASLAEMLAASKDDLGRALDILARLEAEQATAPTGGTKGEVRGPSVSHPAFQFCTSCIVNGWSNDWQFACLHGHDYCGEQWQLWTSWSSVQALPDILLDIDLLADHVV